jgi:peptidoglycan hydrolase-like protein with peptidoglycan-binding domain
MLYDIYSREELATAPPNMIDPFPRFPNDYSIGKGEPIGSEGSLLTSIIQIMLIELSSLYDEILNEGIKSPPYPSGIFDDKTENAVKSFQRTNGLSPSGRVDKQTWNTLSLVYNKHNFSGNQ